MKAIKTLTIFALIFFFVFSCSKGNSDEQTQNTDSLDSIQLAKNYNAVFDTLAGKKVYESKCLVCHQQNGEGVPGIYPPLANADYLLADKKRAVYQIVNGVSDSIVVNGKPYRGGVMPQIELTSEQVKDVTNYILNSWGNKGGLVTVDDVKAVQK